MKYNIRPRLIRVLKKPRKRLLEVFQRLDPSDRYCLSEPAIELKLRDMTIRLSVSELLVLF